MGRPKREPLWIYLNNRLVGSLEKASNGAVTFRYDMTWIDAPNAIPVSMSLPLGARAFQGDKVSAVFDNLLPDSLDLRGRVAEKVGAPGNDFFSLLSCIGRDCVGALQLVVDKTDIPARRELRSTIANDLEIEAILKNLPRAPFGIDRDEDFRISVAGAQEKTALLFHDGRWRKPHGTTPTTHILKPAIGTHPIGIDLSTSVENEFYCIALAKAFGLPVNDAEIETFGSVKALVVKRFDRKLLEDGTYLRIPQEDLCQALSIPPSRKYQSEGGPSIADILIFLQASEEPHTDQTTFLTAQLFFWLITATDGHAKNFSIFLRPNGLFRLAPLYDILSVQPSLDLGEIERKQIRMAMSVGAGRHYRPDEIQPRHFVETAERSKLSKTIVRDAFAQIVEKCADAFDDVEHCLPAGFPMQIHASIKAVAMKRLRLIVEAKLV